MCYGAGANQLVIPMNPNNGLAFVPLSSRQSWCRNASGRLRIEHDLRRVGLSPAEQIGAVSV